ncbi:MAG: NACHT domain-containing protein [Spirosomataceae bacterium]
MIEVIQEYFDKAVAFFQEIFNTGKGDFYGGLLGALVILLLSIFVKKPFNFLLKGMSIFRDRQFIIPRALRKYKECLDNETYKLSHSWKLEDQTLKEIIVPVHIENAAERTSLVEHINLIFSNQNAKNQRFILLGEAGSGKSVAMGEIARKVWEVKIATTLLPVLLKFSEIKYVRDEAAFLDAIVKNLERNQFEEGRNTHKAEEYVKQHLYNGSILLLLDGFDELEKTTRFEIAQFLNHFLKTYQSIPFVISCRNSVWKQNPTIFQPLNLSTILMANFTPYDIRVFVSQWKFIDNKSGDQLADLINSKTYLKNIATNPLMLTIITFLYAQPKRVLPDNRVKFYEECVDALLEKWDNSKTVDRANAFETIDKVSILSYLAYQHITDSKTTDEEIPKENVLKGIEIVMRMLSRPVEKREKMLSELVENAELLIALPPDGYKFPHRTFMEYFAAKYFYENNKLDELLTLYQSDSGKWEETLCLFCGINTNSETADKVLQTFINDFISTSKLFAPNTIVFRLLVESARINPQLANQILDLGEAYLKVSINKEIVENLGFIAINPNWEHAKKAKDILIKEVGNYKLNKYDSHQYDFQMIIMALGSIKDADIQNIILKYADRIDIVKFLTKLGEDAEIYAQKLLESLKIEKSIEVLEGMREAGNLSYLMKLMVKSTNETLQQEAALQLATLPLVTFDNLPFDDVNPNLKKEAEKKHKEWGWKYEYPKTLNGQKGIFLTSILISRLVLKGKKLGQVQINKFIDFLVLAFLLENNCKFTRYSIFFPDVKREVFNANYKGLLAIWKKRGIPFGYLITISTFISFTVYYYILIKGNITFLFSYLILSTILALISQKKNKERFHLIVGLIVCFPILLFVLFIGNGVSVRNLKLVKTENFLVFFLVIAASVVFIYPTLMFPFLKYLIILPNILGLLYFCFSPFVFPVITFLFPNQALIQYLQNNNEPLTREELHRIIRKKLDNLQSPLPQKPVS